MDCHTIWIVQCTFIVPTHDEPPSLQASKSQHSRVPQ